MQDQGEIARAFAAWQRAHQKLADAEDRLAAATRAWQLGLQARPDTLREEVRNLKAEQDWRYDAAAEALRRRGGASASTGSADGRPGRAGGSTPQPA